MKNTGLRNNNMFCFNCGQSESMDLPRPIKEMIAVTKDFDRRHKNCKAVWTEPVNIYANDPDRTEEQNCDWWLANGDRGQSSMAMYRRMFRCLQHKPMAHPNHYPYDHKDFGRCLKLLEAVPSFRKKLSIMAAVSWEWRKIVENWDKLENLYYNDSDPLKDNFMKELKATTFNTEE